MTVFKIEDKNASELVQRQKIIIHGDDSRVITRAHIPGELTRINNIINRVLKLTNGGVERELQKVYRDFESRHRNLDHQLIKHFNKVSEYIPACVQLSQNMRMLIGAYLTMEYSIESAALFNPSIVAHPNQKYVVDGCLRFIMSLRATGEGHISSIVFRSGVINTDGSFSFDETSRYVEQASVCHNSAYDKHLFQLKLQDLDAWDETSIRIFDQIPDTFSYQELKVSIGVLYLDTDFECNDKVIEIIYWVANSNYTLQFDETSSISERVIFPSSDNESRGIEDARFVMFKDDNGEETYYATYTAYNGFSILPQLIETKDFLRFKVMTLNGEAVQNKGMALFPRKINGKYVMLSRQDGENNHIMFSDHLHFWQSSQIIQEPTKPWEFIQIGNCGSPIETDKGWLVLTHGVGAMRQYAIGAILLDLDNPTKVIARLDEPLITPTKTEREGYVPNVIYSCGGLLLHQQLIIPYAMSDISTGIATINVKDLLESMTFMNNNE
ncbi:glycoside hydrolase family 130 protein [Carboxylicivirga mesophila]|uniref:Glycoside hydrolase family 130 protein n=1 Tax=Carboxylicivirga mesophila TaxID=1166478 RepID=A0ABS5KAY3_9BACT|nr:glycoside hydrolase family 130 protein [Carboxylicivirga mesophila]MBS2212188.1 glycoside hydrolase family 130 protein [Carboxylicivirga mesophila]